MKPNCDNNDIKDSIEQLYDLLDNKPDDISSVHDFIVFLRSILMLENADTLPKKEIMTLIKHHKPNVFWGLKRMSSQNVMLDLLTHLSMDLETAEQNLENMVK